MPQIRCQLHDHARQYDNDDACHNKWNGGKLHGNISRNASGNAIIGRYGGCFEEVNGGCYGTGESCVTQERLAMVEGRKVRIIHRLNISHKRTHILIAKIYKLSKQSITHMLLGGKKRPSLVPDRHS